MRNLDRAFPSEGQNGATDYDIEDKLYAFLEPSTFRIKTVRQKKCINGFVELLCCRQSAEVRDQNNQPD